MFETAIEAPKMSKQDIAAYMHEIMGAYKFAPDRKRGRPGRYDKVGAPRSVDVSTVLLLEQAFSIGCSLNEALAHAKIGKTAYYSWLELNPQFQERIVQLQANPILRARESLYKSTKFDGDLSLKYLERKLPDEFSLKATVTHNVEFTGISLEKPEREKVDTIEVERMLE